MRILSHLHKYPPVHNAGAEWYAHSIHRWLAGRGHEVRVIVSGVAGSYEFQGIPVSGVRRALDAHSWADVVLTHLDTTRQAMRTARLAGKPLVHLVHNDRQLAYWNVHPRDCALAVFNSHWVDGESHWRGPSLVLPPPVFVEDYAPAPGPHNAVTLINLSEQKGGYLFWELAERMAPQRFLAVRGAYAEQILPHHLPGNVDLWENTPDARAIYGETWVLLMPSAYESWGRTAIEAACSGIPTVAHPTPGLRESLGSAGMFVPREKLERWERAIRRLQDPERYRRAGEAYLARALELAPEPGLEKLELELEQIARLARA